MAASADYTPKAYLVKEVQSVISWVILNHVNTQGTMTRTERKELMFNLYHGLTKDPKKVGFARQCVLGCSIFRHLFVECKKDKNARLTDSPNSHVTFQINPRLLPGEDKPVFVGTGPTAHIRLEHLEVASVHQAKKGNRKLIASRTLFRSAMTVSANLKTMLPLVTTQILNANGEMPSGKNDDDFFAELAVKVLESKAKGIFVETPSDDDVTPPVETQGVEAEKKAEKQNKMKWTYKAIPAAGWFAVCLFTKNGIATEHVKNSLPLIMDKDYGTLENRPVHHT